LNSNPNNNTSSLLSLVDPVGAPPTPSSYKGDYEKLHIRTPTTPTSTKTTEKSSSPTNSLVELELHTSSFFDTARLRHPTVSSTNKEQQRRNRASAFVDSSRYYSSNNSKINSSTPSRPASRRPLSLSLENQNLNDPSDYRYSSIIDSNIPSSTTTTTSQPYPRRTRRTISPASNKTSSTNYSTNHRLSSPPSSYRYTLAASPESSRRTTSPTTSSRYPVSHDFDPISSDMKRKPIYKYTPSNVSSTSTATTTTTTASELNVVPSLSNSTSPVAPSVFTTSGIKFAPAPSRLSNLIREPEQTNRFLNSTLTNPSSNLDTNLLNSTARTTTNRRSLLTSMDLPAPNTSPRTNHRNSRLLDDNNNLISSKVHDL